MKILVVDDDLEICQLLAQFLKSEHYTPYVAHCGTELFDLLSKIDIDLIILDVMLPGDDGFTLCQKLRELSQLPIIMLTANGETNARITGLEMGADDYLAKPFSPRELLARIKAVSRRSQGLTDTLPPHYKQFASWILDMQNRRLLTDDKMEISLSAGEYDLLQAFVLKPQTILSRDTLLDVTKNRAAGPFDRSIDVQISRLRHKIESDPKNPKFIKTVRGGGYLLACEVKDI